MGKSLKISKFMDKYSKRDKSRFLFCYLFVLFPVCQFAIFFIYINFNSILLAFQDSKGAFTMQNFFDVFKAIKGVDNYGLSIGTSLKHSIVLWLWTKIIIFPISIVSTYVLFKRIRFHYFFRVVFAIPGVIGAVIWTSVLKYMVSYDGPVLMLMNSMGIEMSTLVQREGLLGAAETAFPTMVTFTVLSIVGGDVVLTGAFTRVPNEIFESARLDGAGFWTECVKIAIPCVGPTISTILTFALCSVFVADCNVYLYTNGSGEPDASTMGFYFLMLQYRVSTTAAGQQLYNYPAAVGVVVSAITLPFVFFGRWLLDKIFEPVDF